MNPYIGDRQLDPDEEPEMCELCGGARFINLQGKLIDCPDCATDSDPGESKAYPDS